MAINDAGQVIGNGTALGAFLYYNGRLVALGVPPGATGTGARAINSAGQIVGATYFNGTPTHGGPNSNGSSDRFGHVPRSFGHPGDCNQ